MAFILAGIVAVLTIVWCLLEAFASGMSSSPSASAEVNARIPWHFGIGMAIAALLVASHWLPRISW